MDAKWKQRLLLNWYSRILHTPFFLLCFLLFSFWCFGSCRIANKFRTEDKRIPNSFLCIHDKRREFWDWEILPFIIFKCELWQIVLKWLHLFALCLMWITTLPTAYYILTFGGYFVNVWNYNDNVLISNDLWRSMTFLYIVFLSVKVLGGGDSTRFVLYKL